jgi:hypothetical protein
MDGKIIKLTNIPIILGLRDRISFIFVNSSSNSIKSGKRSLFSTSRTLFVINLFLSPGSKSAGH